VLPNQITAVAKQLYLILLIVFYANFNNSLAAQETINPLQPNNQKSENLDFLKTTNGKYPFAIKLFNNAALAHRLKKLLGNRYQFLKKTWAVETPIEIKDNIFIAQGCQTHNCTSTNFIIVFDFLKNVLYAGIREDEKPKTYSENGSTSPKLLEWSVSN
jgi:hypothetical protein